MVGELLTLNKLTGSRIGLCDCLGCSLAYFPVKRGGGCGLGGRSAMVEGRVVQPVENGIAQAGGGSAIHDGVLAHESGVGIVKDNELTGLIDPAVAKTNRDPVLDVSMPKGSAMVDGVLRSGVIENNDECRRLNGLEDFCISSRGREFDVILGLIV